jgi:hypothetical protein
MVYDRLLPAQSQRGHPRQRSQRSEEKEGHLEGRARLLSRPSPNGESACLLVPCC